jgi:hypothetical protein
MAEFTPVLADAADRADTAVGRLGQVVALEQGDHAALRGARADPSDSAWPGRLHAREEET